MSKIAICLLKHNSLTTYCWYFLITICFHQTQIHILRLYLCALVEVSRFDSITNLRCFCINTTLIDIKIFEVERISEANYVENPSKQLFVDA